MKRKLLFAATAALFALQPMQADAQLTAPSTESFQFLRSVSGGVTGPYEALWTSSAAGSTPITIYCIDYHHSIRGGQQWNANVSSLTSGDLSMTRLGYSGGAAPNAMGRYIAAAYLASLMESTTSTSQWATYHRAIWETTSQRGYSNGNDATVQMAANVANTVMGGGSVAGFNPDEWMILTDVRAAGDLYGAQEFVTRVSVPEPSTLFLMVAGLGLLAVAARRRRDIGELA